ncbi:glutaminase A [Hydrogenophaga aquatica]
MHSPIQSYLEKLHEQLKPMRGGSLASYIPELARVDPDQFAICLVTADGVAYAVGDSDQPFTIQSISKAFVYATALADRGQDQVSAKVGVEPSGDAFNSISLHPQTGAPLNPMINAGAIATTSLVSGDGVQAQWERIHQALSMFAGRPLGVDEQVYQSESDTGFRNRGIAWMLKNFGIIEGDPMASLENYFRQCSVLVSCLDLAYMAATLANRGIHPVTGERAVPAEYVERVLSVMASCGMYDFAGSWLTEVGMPAKSGVGGGIVAVLPGRFGIAVFSPRLDAKGNSVRGIEVCKRLSRDFGLNIFASTNDPRMALGRIYTGADAPSRRQPGGELKVYLKEQAHRIKYLCLHGFLAVDGIEHVIRCMQSLTSPDAATVREAPGANSFILDMHRVDGISDSAARLLNQARLALAEEGVAVVFSRIHGRAGIVGPLSKSVARRDGGFLSFEDNDLAVEWCENRLIAEANRLQPASGELRDAVLFKGLPEPLLRDMEAVSHREDYAAGAQILRSGQAGDGRIFFIESGNVSILVPLEDGAHQRISTLGPGLIFGEMVLLGQTTRSASVFADTPVRCIVFEADRLAPIWDREPQLKIVLLENLARDMAQKLRSSTQWIAALA